MLLIGQANNTRSYKRLNILSSLMNLPQAMYLLKIKKDVLQVQVTNLFGNNFLYQHLVETVQGKKQPKKLLLKKYIRDVFRK